MPPLALDGRTAVHDLRDEVSIDCVAGLFHRVLRTFTILLVACHAGWTADTRAVRARIAQGVVCRTDIRYAHHVAAVRGDAGRHEGVVVAEDIDDDVPLLIVGVSCAVRYEDADCLGGSGGRGRTRGYRGKDCGRIALGCGEGAGSSLSPNTVAVSQLDRIVVEVRTNVPQPLKLPLPLTVPDDTMETMPIPCAGQMVPVPVSVPVPEPYPPDESENPVSTRSGKETATKRGQKHLHPVMMALPIKVPVVAMM